MYFKTFQLMLLFFACEHVVSAFFHSKEIFFFLCPCLWASDTCPFKMYVRVFLSFSVKGLFGCR